MPRRESRALETRRGSAREACWCTSPRSQAGGPVATSRGTGGPSPQQRLERRGAPAAAREEEQRGDGGREGRAREGLQDQVPPEQSHCEKRLRKSRPLKSSAEYHPQYH
eukprot:scaffold8275_cov61-Phaeocystis_antarctica.AAC.7